jgi:hypothetical protein
MRKISLTILLLSTIMFSCQKKEKDFVYLEQQLINAGYHGQYERPSGAFQKAAIGILGVEDLLAYSDDNNRFAVIKLKPGNEEDIFDRIAPVMSLLEHYLNENDRQEVTKSLKNIRENSLQHNNILLVWDKYKPADAEKLIKRNF